MFKKLKTFLKPSELSYNELSKDAQNYIFKARLIAVAIPSLLIIIALISRNYQLLFVLPVIVVCFIAYYFSRIRPFYQGKVMVLHGSIAADEGGERVKIPLLGKRFTRRDVAIKNGDKFFVTTVSSKIKFHFDDEVDIYLLENSIDSVNTNTYKIFDYFFIVKTATYFKE